MRRRTKIGLVLGTAAALALVLFLLPVVPMSVQYACWAPTSSMCPAPSTHVSVTFAALGVGVVYITGYQNPVYCWMNGNPANNPYVNNDAMCNDMVQ